MLKLHRGKQVRHHHHRNLVHDVSGIFTVLAIFFLLAADD
jgi:hypothetical protein